MQYSIQKEFVDIFQALEHFSIYNMWCYVVWYSFYEFSTKMKLLSLSLEDYKRSRTVFPNRRAAAQYRAARGSPGICHFIFLSNFHE